MPCEERHASVSASETQQSMSTTVFIIIAHQVCNPKIFTTFTTACATSATARCVSMCKQNWILDCGGHPCPEGHRFNFRRNSLILEYHQMSYMCGVLTIFISHQSPQQYGVPDYQVTVSKKFEGCFTLSSLTRLFHQMIYPQACR